MLGLAAVCLGVAALAAAAFILSYSGIRAVALRSGVSPQHAGDYPVLIDAMVVIALLAVIGLRGSGLPSRTLSWLALLAVLAVGAAADVQFATGRVLMRHNAAATTAAVLPWALVFIAFLLLLALLRHGRLRHQVSAARRRSWAADAPPALADQPAPTPPAPSLPVRTPPARDSASIVPGFSARLVSSAAAGAAAAAAGQPGPAPDSDEHDPGDSGRGQEDTLLGSAGAGDTEPRERADAARAEPGDDAAAPADPPAAAADHPADPHETEPAEAEPADAAAVPAEPLEEPADAAAVPAEPLEEPADAAAESDDPPAADSGVRATPADTGSVDVVPAQDNSDDQATCAAAVADQGTDDDVPDNMPVFHRMWTTPTAPDS
jgi:Protein of unknown function (DUF2637)